MKWEKSLSTKRLVSQLEELENFWAEVCHRPSRRKETVERLKQKKSSLLSVRPRTAKQGDNVLFSSPVYREESSGRLQCSPKERVLSPSSSKQVSSLRHVVMASRKQKEEAQVSSESTVDSDEKASLVHHRNSFSPHPARKAIIKESVVPFSSAPQPSTSPNPHCAQERFVRGRSRGDGAQARSPRGKDAQRCSSNRNLCQSPEKQKNVVQKAKEGMERLKSDGTRAEVVNKASKISLFLEREDLCLPSRQRELSKKNYSSNLSTREEPALPSFVRRSSLPKGFKVYNAEEMDVLIVTPISRTVVSSSGSWNSVTPSGDSKVNNLISSSPSDGMIADSHHQVPVATAPVRSPHTPPKKNSSSCSPNDETCTNGTNRSPFIRPKITSSSKRHNITVGSPWTSKRMRMVQTERKDERQNAETEGLVCCKCGQKKLQPGSNFCTNCGSSLR